MGTMLPGSGWLMPLSSVLLLWRSSSLLTALVRKRLAQHLLTYLRAGQTQARLWTGTKMGPHWAVVAMPSATLGQSQLSNLAQSPAELALCESPGPPR